MPSDARRNRVSWPPQQKCRILLQIFFCLSQLCCWYTDTWDHVVCFRCNRVSIGNSQITMKNINGIIYIWKATTTTYITRFAVNAFPSSLIQTHYFIIRMIVGEELASGSTGHLNRYPTWIKRTSFISLAPYFYISTAWRPPQCTSTFFSSLIATQQRYELAIWIKNPRKAPQFTAWNREEQ